jgi:hypothetical protein
MMTYVGCGALLGYPDDICSRPLSLIVLGSGGCDFLLPSRTFLQKLIVVSQAARCLSFGSPSTRDQELGVTFLGLPCSLSGC